METIRQRFEERFKPTPYGIFRDGKIWHPEYAPLTHENVQAFIAQELTLLATKIDTRIIDSNFSPHIQIGFGKGTSEAAAIIRAHAKSLEE